MDYLKELKFAQRSNKFYVLIDKMQKSQLINMLRNLIEGQIGMPKCSTKSLFVYDWRKVYLFMIDEKPICLWSTKSLYVFRRTKHVFSFGTFEILYWRHVYLSIFRFQNKIPDTNIYDVANAQISNLVVPLCSYILSFKGNAAKSLIKFREIPFIK